MGVTANGHVVSLWGEGNIPELDNGGGWHNAVSVPHATELCAFKWRILWCSHVGSVCVEFTVKQSPTSKATACSDPVWLV